MRLLWLKKHFEASKSLFYRNNMSEIILAIKEIPPTRSRVKSKVEYTTINLTRQFEMVLLTFVCFSPHLGVDESTDETDSNEVSCVNGVSRLFQEKRSANSFNLERYQTGRNIYIELKSYVAENDLSVQKLRVIITDGAPFKDRQAKRLSCACHNCALINDRGSSLSKFFIHYKTVAIFMKLFYSSLFNIAICISKYFLVRLCKRNTS